MTTFFAEGGTDAVLAEDDLRCGLGAALDVLGERRRILAVPPDFTRCDSRAGILTRLLHERVGEALVDVLPALGTHDPMTAEQIAKMYAGVPGELFRVHDWRHDVVDVGALPADFVREASGGICDRPWPAQLNRLIVEGGHDLVCSIGQVVPHEVVGMANQAKNLFVGAGGTAGINESHFIGAAYGMERMMGRIDTPVRRILSEAWRRFCADVPILWVLTVVGDAREGEAAADRGLVTRGLFVGDDDDCFERAAELSRAVNFRILDEEPAKIVVNLDEDEFHSTWLGNKSIYRTRMAIADDAELIVLAPGLRTFGEDAEIDRLIRRHGYRTTPEIMRFLDEDGDLRRNLSAAAHLIHGSSEGRFRVTYCPGHLTREEIEGVGYRWADLGEMRRRYDPAVLRPGWNDVDGERVYYIPNPALGLWAARSRLGS